MRIWKPSERMHYSCGRETKSINEKMKIQIKRKPIMILHSDNDHLVHYLLKEKTQENGPFGTGLWIDS